MVTANIYRYGDINRHPKHNIAAMVHSLGCGFVVDRPWWREYPSLRAAEADIGPQTFASKCCMRGQGTHFDPVRDAW